jgi:DNA-directed RNA polymerase specialized sigma24 family protein
VIVSREPDDTTLARVYAAATAAAADRRVAEDATVRAFASADSRGADAERLSATAIRLALRAAPAPAFARMRLPDAEAVALCRLLRLDVGGVAALLGIAAPEVRRRLTRGLAEMRPEPAW